MTRLGDRYVFGATGPRRFDCSGLVQWAYRQVGIGTTHYTGTLWNDYRHIPESQLKPGDLVFFYRDHHHVGIYIGNGLMINAPHWGRRAHSVDLRSRVLLRSSSRRRLAAAAATRGAESRRARRARG